MKANGPWANTTLGALGDWHGGGTPSKGNAAFWTGGTIPWISPKDMKVLRIVDSVDQISESALRSSAAKLVPAGSVLMVVRSGILSHTFPVAVSAIPVALNQDMKALSPNPEIDPFFVCYYLIRSGSTILGSCAKTGTTVPSIETVALKDFPIPVPPLPEQRQIVAAIEMHFSRLDAAVASLTRARASVKRARASVLKAAVEGRLVPTEAALAGAEGRDYEPASALLERILTDRKAAWAAAGAKGKYKEPAKPDTTSLPDLPEGWVWATVDELLLGILAGKSFTAENNPPGPDEVGIVKISAVTWGRYDELEAKTVRDAAKVNPAYFVQQGDLLFSRANTIELVGALVIADQVTRRIMLSDKILRLDVADGHNKWVMWTLRSRLGRAQIEALATGNQNSMRNIGQDRLRGVILPLPPLAEQRRIVAEVDRRLSVLDALEGALEASLARCGRLRQAILKRAFEGRLVPAEGAEANGGEVVAGDKMYIDLES